MKKEIWIPVLTGVVITGLLIFAARTLPIVLIFIPAVIIALIISLKITNQKAPEPSEILPLYLLALAVQCLHFAEEYVMGFNMVIPALLGQPELPLNDWVIFNMVAYCLFILGGIIFLQKIKMVMIIPLFFIVAGVFMNTVGHLILSMWQMKYLPGLITVFIFIPLMPGFVKALRQN